MNAPVTTTRTAQPATTTEKGATPLPLPGELLERIHVDAALESRLDRQRQAVQRILTGEDSRLLVVVGPCSIHDPDAALEYADRLAALGDEISERVLPVMRVYVEKPRTTVGWKGLAYDPDLNGAGDMAKGVTRSRELMHAVASRGLPVATELLQPMLAPYLEDLLSWVAIGARTTECQLHRELASDLRAAVGFKNATSGDVQVAIDAMQAAAHPHQRFAQNAQGRPIMRQSAGNPHTHVVLRGGHGEPNYQSHHVRQAIQTLQAAGQNPRLMVDCSHANARKDHRRQSEVMLDVLDQRRAGEANLVALMLESHLFEGKQALNPGAMRYGVSITDACVGWDTTEHLLKTAAERLA
ncbi:3-deoxy-7-phosphoheptulonate synthase [Halomonas sp. PAMB 3232]|uniref:3-deoxy-7-phosphoheptulonate synthase n=1 Tax=Halomonas sp. PAMB 3232 TaxID=3075221 RepID=UPI00289F6897|nr:3-deoxy-7-phosphoheptulonate synthase [Halomonas sp. PAMB 3232]WNL39463.1 3-deoxy-7-phosphoheptulonate synthase [Halomonas sp. PAMB 3232]